MKAVFVYSKKSGRGSIASRLDYIKSRLEKHYEKVFYHESASFEDLESIIKLASDKYDDLIFAGGDGTFNAIINLVMRLDHKPILGYIPSGTINDMAKNFHIRNSIRKALDVIISNKTKEFDVCKINDSYFGYVAAIGAYADIAYSTDQLPKRFFGRLAYYHRALVKTLVPTRIKAEVVTKDRKFQCVTPFVLILNGTHVGGFSINPKCDISDGMFDVFLTKPGLFNGLLHYLFFKIRTNHLKVSEISIKPNSNENWCLDGERGPAGEVKILAIPRALKIYSR